MDVKWIFIIIKDFLGLSILQYISIKKYLFRQYLTIPSEEESSKLCYALCQARHCSGIGTFLPCNLKDIIVLPATRLLYQLHLDYFSHLLHRPDQKCSESGSPDYFLVVLGRESEVLLFHPHCIKIMKKCVNKTFLTLDIMVNIGFCLINYLILKKSEN